MDNSRFKFRAFVPWLNKKIFKVERMFFDEGGLYALQLFANEYHRYDIHSDLPAWEKEPPILIQFTGLLDCDGKEIFEGDVVARTDDDSNKLFIEFRLGGFRALFSLEEEEGAHLTQITHYSNSKWKVIGNRFENPELLEIKND